jgi:catechol 2,3-dioxygenase-like lactoylglutathione lyase family enzyme
MCDDPGRMRDWYHKWFGFEEYNRTPEGTIYITDGYFSVGLLQRLSAVSEEQHERGTHHFGFQIDSIVEIERNLEDFDPSIRIERRPSEDPYAQYRLRDPEGIVVDLSETGYGVDGQQGLPAIRHLATFNRDIPHKHAFYLQVMGMRDATRTFAEVERHLIMTAGKVPEGYVQPPARFGGDGFVNFAILAERDAPAERGRTYGFFDHFGVLLRNPREKMLEIRATEPSDEPLDVRPADRQVEYGVRDPEGNRLDLSGEKGWKLDEVHWARVE